MLLPEGTDIFSDRITIGGKTMADRKLAREIKLNKMRMKLDKDPSNAVLKKTYDKLQSDTEFENESDLNLQKDIAEIFGADDMTIPKAGFGLKDLGLTTGDALGIISQMYSAFQPKKDVLKNRAGDTPVKNYYKEFGKEALKGIDAYENLLGQLQDSQLQDIESSAITARKANRAGARGINTVRALDLATQQAANKAAEDVYEQTAKSMADLTDKRADLETKIDEVKTQGQVMADNMNRAMRDAFETNLSAANQAKWAGLQMLGKHLNTVKERDTKKEVISEMFENFTLDAAGNIIAKPVVDKDTEEEYK
jgi:hypothetical protein